MYCDVDPQSKLVYSAGTGLVGCVDAIIKPSPYLFFPTFPSFIYIKFLRQLSPRIPIRIGDPHPQCPPQRRVANTRIYALYLCILIPF